MRPRWSLAALVLACGSALAGAMELKPFTASYSINWHGLAAGSTELKLEQLPDGRWSYSSHSSAHGLFRLAMPAELASRSLFRIEEGQLVPERFTADDGATSDAKDQDITFDWAAARVRGVAERHKVDLPTQPGLLDTLSVQVALMNELLRGRTPARFVLLDKDRIKDYVYSAEGHERLKTDIGEYDTMIYRSARPGSDNGTWFWCAPELGYLPLKVERRDGDDVQWSMRLRSVQR